MSEEKDQTIEALLRLAKSGPATAELAYAEGHHDLKTRVEEHHGTWEMGLATALKEAAKTWRPTPPTPIAEVVERRVGAAFDHPLYIETLDGRLYTLHGPDLPTTTKGRILDPEIPIRALHYIGATDTVALFTSAGQFFGLDQRMIPLWDRRHERRSIRDVLMLPSGEGVRAITTRRSMATGRVIHVTARGRGKATDAPEFGSGIERSGLEAFLLKDDDALVTVLAGPSENTVFCASALGQGIHFAADDLRSMGRKAVGVNLMKLGDERDAIVGALLGKNVRQVAVLTATGIGKRVDFLEFRTQGRAGQGMQLIRLDPDNHVAAVAPCNPGDDLAIVTSANRVFRIPTAEFPLMGRPAKGNALLDLQPGETILSLSALPCSG